MAFRTWGRLLLTALGVSVLAGAGQLGIAYGFGVVRLDGAFADGSVSRWPAQLAWVGWFAAVAAVAGTVLTERLARRDGFPGGTTEQLAVAGAAALGATVVAPLCMQPARAAELGGTVDPVWAVGICAILGAVVGAGASIAVLLKPPFGWNVGLTAAVVWLLALLSVAPAVASAQPLHTVRLGVLEPSWLDAGAAQRLAMLVLPAVALLAGAAVGALARRRGHPPLVGGAAGAAGPVLLAFAYLAAGPGEAADRYQLAPYYGALIAVAAGALGSAATTVRRRPVTEAGSDAIEPTDILQPLPPSPEPPDAPAAETSALATLPAPDGTDHEPARTTGGRETDPTNAGRHTPAHWDWPVPAGVTPAPMPAGRARQEDVAFAERPLAASPDEPGPAHLAGDAPGPADPTRVDLFGTPGRDEPVAAGLVGGAGPDEPTRADLSGDPRADDLPVAGRDTEDLMRSLPVPGLLPPGRRTAAIDVLAAGRPAPATPHATGEQPADPTPAGGPELPATAASVSDLAAQRPTAPSEPAPTAAAEVPGSPAAQQAAVPAAHATTAPPTAPQSRRQRPSSSATRATGAAGTDPATAMSTSGPGGADPAPPAALAETPAAETPAAATPAAETPAAETPAAAVPAADRPAPAEPRPTGRSKRSRKGHTSPAVTEPAGTAASPEPADSPGRPLAVEPPAAPAAETSDAPAATTGGRSTQRDFFFDPEPVGADVADPVDAPASPGPRFPIFEDVSDGPGSVRPAWPIAPASNWPVNPGDGAGAPDATEPDATTGNDGTPTEVAPAEPAPRPRHRALPDLARGAAWDALATARRATPTTPGAPGEDGRHAAAGTPPTADGPHTGEHAAAPTEATDEPGNGKAKQRRSLFRRNRAKGGEVIETESLAQDEEYVDWVAGLASDDDADDADDARILRTGRHHRD